MADSILYEQNGAVVTLTVNEPETRNAISTGVVEGLVAACARINGDMSVSCVILTGAGKGFSSGGNVKDMRDKQGLFAGQSVDIRRAYQHGIQKIPLAFQAIEVPTIAAVNGAAIGAGCDLSLCCDIRIASEDATFAESFLKVGLISGDGGSWLLPRVVGFSRACELTFTGDTIDALTAEKWGLVSRVVPAAQLMEEANKLAAKIAAHPRHSLRLNKKLLRQSQSISLEASLEMAAGMQSIVQHTWDQNEAVMAMLEKRKPAFQGR